jgi:hypothetical protein
MADWLTYSNTGATRNQPLSSQLVDALSFLADMGVTANVFSGGQPHAGGGPRVGSTRHDAGMSGDVTFMKDGRVLDWNNPQDIPIFQEIVRRGKERGITGFGAGPGYMSEGSMHIGFGAPAVWGAGGKSANAPDWLREAYGVPASGGYTTTMSSKGGAKPMGLLDMQDEPQTFAERLKSQWQSGELKDRIALAANTLRMEPDRNLAAALQGRQQAREDKATANRTAQWLASQGRTDLAQAMMTGALDAKSAVAIAMQPVDPLAELNKEKLALEVEKLKNPQPGFRPATAQEAATYGATSGQIGPDGRFYPGEATQTEKGVVVDKRIVNPVTGEVIYEPTPGAATNLTDEQLSNINTLRDDLRTQTANFDIVKNGFDNVKAFYESPGAVSDYALAVGFAKIVDPGSVAREGEVQAVANAGAMFPSLGTALKNAFDGTGKLTPETRAEIFALAQKIYVNKANDTTATIEQYKELAKRSGLPEDMLWMGGPIAMPGPQNVQTPSPAPTAPPPAPTGLPGLPTQPTVRTFNPVTGRLE